MMTGKNTRLLLPDVLKGLAVIFMIQVHVVEQFVHPDLLLSTYGRLSLFLGGVPAAPVFMIVMGYFVGRTKAGSAKLIKRGLALFGGGILLNILLNLSIIIQLIQNAYPELIYGSVFGADILPLAGISLIIIGGLTRISKHPVFYILSAFLVAGLSPLINQLIDSNPDARYLTAFIGGSAKWSYFPLFPWLAYPLIGLAGYYALPRVSKVVTGGLRWLVMAIALIGFFSGLKMGFNTSFSLGLYYHHGILFFLWALSFVILIIGFMDLMNPEKNPLRFALLSFLGREVTLIYVIQWILIGNLAAWTGKEFMQAGHLLWTIGISLATILFAFIYRQIINKL